MPESKVLAAPRSSSPGGWHVIYPRQPSSRGLRLTDGENSVGASALR